MGDSTAAALQVHMQRITCYLLPNRHVEDVSRRWQKLLEVPGSTRSQVMNAG